MPDRAGDPLARLIVLSDAIFAFAITLLALDIRLPDLGAITTPDALIAALHVLGAPIGAFVLSFLVIAAFWLGHVRVFRVVRRLDGRLLAINLAFLFLIVLLPFPTSVMARAGDQPVAAVLYAAFVLATGALSAVLWSYAAEIGHLVTDHVTPDLARRVRLRSLVVPAVFGLSIPFALVNTRVATLIWILAVPAQMVVTRRLGLSASLDGASRPGSPPA